MDQAGIGVAMGYGVAVIAAVVLACCVAGLRSIARSRERSDEEDE